jgi:protein-tyrosine kinase
MSIVDALEKAKRLAETRADPVRQQMQKRRAASRTLPGSMQVASSRADAPTHPASDREKIDFPALSYDRAVCCSNRIIVPDADSRLAQAAPAYRMLRTRILQRCRVNNWSTLAITSPGPGEGKSVTALNLAISIAREGNQDAFLIDLDMRNPSICRYLGVPPPASTVQEFFAGKASARDLFFTVGLDRLTVAGSTDGVGNASELLATDRLEELLQFIKELSPNPMIVCDLPPVVNTDDALVVAPRMDAFALVVSEGGTRRDSLQQALDLLSDFPLAGVVLNQSYESLGSEYYGAY